MLLPFLCVSDRRTDSVIRRHADPVDTCYCTFSYNQVPGDCLFLAWQPILDQLWGAEYIQNGQSWCSSVPPYKIHSSVHKVAISSVGSERSVSAIGLEITGNDVRLLVLWNLAVEVLDLFQ